MSQKTYAELIAQATIIRNETVSKANTALRVGQMLIDMLDSLSFDSNTVFQNDIVVSLSGGKTLGKYTNGQTIPAAGKTMEEVLNLIATEYIFPVWNSFTFSGFSETVERGTTLSGSKSWTWSITNNSGNVLTIDIYDVTAGSALLANTPNDGSQSQSITSVTLTNAGDTQVWKGIAHDTGSNPSDIDSELLTVTARLKGYFGDTAATVTNSATVKALPNNFFEIPGTQVIVLPTGTTNTIFEICTTKTLVSVTDDDAFDAPIAFTLINTISVLDAAGTSYTVNHYSYTSSVPYTPSQHHLRATLS